MGEKEMKKTLSVVVASVAALTLITGCAGISNGSDMSAHVKEDASICKTAIYVGHRSNESVLKSIEAAGEKNGWRMTAFKANAILAEKSVDGKPYSTTIQIAKEHITCSKDELPASELETLRNSIIEEIKAADKRSH